LGTTNGKIVTGGVRCLRHTGKIGVRRSLGDTIVAGYQCGKSTLSGSGIRKPQPGAKCTYVAVAIAKRDDVRILAGCLRNSATGDKAAGQCSCNEIALEFH
jgi:hypothetical protein